MAHERDIDQVTGTATTGHEWDGIRELNTPLPRWWLWTFYITIIWSVGYWIAYPAWPLVSSYTVGVLNWHSRDAVIADLEALRVQRGAIAERLGKASLQEIVADDNLSQFARAQGRPAFRIARRATAVAAAPRYPNLLDDEWIWRAWRHRSDRDGVRTPGEQGAPGQYAGAWT
jgi:cytochrome c oxidase cbb3-type subunit 3